MATDGTSAPSVATSTSLDAEYNALLSEIGALSLSSHAAATLPAPQHVDATSATGETAPTDSKKGVLAGFVRAGEHPLQENVPPGDASVASHKKATDGGRAAHKSKPNSSRRVDPFEGVGDNAKSWQQWKETQKAGRRRSGDEMEPSSTTTAEGAKDAKGTTVEATEPKYVFGQKFQFKMGAGKATDGASVSTAAALEEKREQKQAVTAESKPVEHKPSQQAASPHSSQHSDATSAKSPPQTTQATLSKDTSTWRQPAAAPSRSSRESTPTPADEPAPSGRRQQATPSPHATPAHEQQRPSPSTTSPPVAIAPHVSTVSPTAVADSRVFSRCAVADTSVLLDDFDFSALGAMPSLEDAFIIIPFIVLVELDGLKAGNSPTAYKARRALVFLRTHLEARVPWLRGQTSEESRVALWMLHGSLERAPADDLILACAHAMQSSLRADPSRSMETVALLTRDTNLAVKASVYSLAAMGGGQWVTAVRQRQDMHRQIRLQLQAAQAVQQAAWGGGGGGGPSAKGTATGDTRPSAK